MTPRAVLMIVHSYCPGDPRVRREAEAIASRGDHVDVLCLRAPGQSVRETVSGVHYWRLPLRRERGGWPRYFFEYISLLLGSALLSIPLHLRHRYRIVQTHNMPDFLVYSSAFPWLSGAAAVLDLHDPVPELFEAKFGLAPTSLPIRMLGEFERLAIMFADAVFVATGAFRDRLVQRGRPADRLQVLLNSPDRALFAERPGEPRSDGSMHLLFHGTVTERSGVDLALLAAEEVRRRGVPLRFSILGDGDALPEIRRLAAEGNRPEWVVVRGSVPFEEIPGYVASCDLGVIPNRPGPFHDLALPTRLFETLAMSRPTVVSRSAAIHQLFRPEEVLDFEAGNLEDLVRVLEKACRDPELRRQSMERGRAVAQKHTWEIERARYLDVLDELFSRDLPTPLPSAR